MTKEAKPELTDAQKLQEVRNLRAGHLAVLNGEYVDALLRLYDAIIESGRTTNLVIEEGIGKIEELRGQLAQVTTERNDLRAALQDSQFLADDWHKVADDRSGEIVRLRGQLKKLQVIVDTQIDQ